MNNLVQRFRALGINQPLAVKLERLINKWERCSGPEWTVNRLKALKAELLGILSNDAKEAAWVARNSEGLPKGPFSELFRIAMSGDKGASKALNALMVYSNFTSDTVTKIQKEKFFGSMESKDITGLGVTVLDKQISLSDKELGFYEWEKILLNVRPWVNQSLSPFCYQPGPDGKSYPETDTYISFVTAITSNAVMRLMRRYSKEFNRVFPTHFAFDMWSEGTVAMKHSESPFKDCIGKISLIQEPGFKLRAVANPNRVVQAALSPLKDFLGLALARIDQDCTFDQSSGVKTVKGWLERGLTVHSVDLSDATNLFPLDFTISALMELGSQYKCNEEYDNIVNLFSDASRQPFFCKLNGKPSLHRFTRGQPLGLGPSFFAFAISHHALLREICNKAHVSDDCYVILGDDIVIADDLVYSMYLKQLNLLGCKVSDGKSFSSKDMAEFAGKIITRKRIIPQFKWREISDRNVVDFVRNLGPGSVELLSTKQKGLINFLACVPTFLGGLGWNPKGIPLGDRLNEPFTSFILNRQVEVLVPSERVDRPLIRFINDERLKDLTPFYTKVDGLKTIIPTREDSPPQWGTKSFWKVFHDAQESLHPFEQVIGENHHLFGKDYRRFYSPLIKDTGDPRVTQPWFDIVRYFVSYSRRSSGQ